MCDIDFNFKTAGLAKSKSQPNENSFQTLQKFLAQFAFMAKTYVQKKKTKTKNTYTHTHTRKEKQKQTKRPVKVGVRRRNSGSNIFVFGFPLCFSCSLLFFDYLYLHCEELK